MQKNYIIEGLIMSIWTPSSWRDKPILQQPTYPNKEELNRVLEELKNYLNIIDIILVKRQKERAPRISGGSR